MVWWGRDVQGRGLVGCFESRVDLGIFVVCCMKRLSWVVGDVVKTGAVACCCHIGPCQLF